MGRFRIPLLVLAAIALFVGSVWLSGSSITAPASAEHAKRHSERPRSSVTTAEQTAPLADDDPESEPVAVDVEDADLEPEAPASTGPHDGSEIAEKFGCLAFERQVALMTDLIGQLSTTKEGEAAARDRLDSVIGVLEMPSEKCAADADEKLDAVCELAAAAPVPLPEVAPLCDP